jgi:hypothetical protein
MTQRREDTIRRWLSKGRIGHELTTRQTAWPYPVLLSPMALGELVKIPRRKRTPHPDARRPADR